MKHGLWIKHEYGARHDRKLKRLLKKHGPAGLGVFWVLIEMLYESVDDGVNPASVAITDIDLLCDECYCQDEALVLSVINDFKLFQVKDGQILAQSVDARIAARMVSVEGGKLGADKRWHKRAPTAKEGDVSVQAFAAEIGELALEAIARKLYMKLSDVTQYLTAFQSDCELKEEDNKDAKQWKKHFINWLEVRIAKGTIDTRKHSDTHTEIPTEFTPRTYG